MPWRGAFQPMINRMGMLYRGGALSARTTISLAVTAVARMRMLISLRRGARDPTSAGCSTSGGP
jgi:hypothetical protein